MHSKPTLKFEGIETLINGKTHRMIPWGVVRAKVPGGWLIGLRASGAGGVTFYPDPKHEWDGSSLP